MCNLLLPVGCCAMQHPQPSFARRLPHIVWALEEQQGGKEQWVVWGVCGLVKNGVSGTHMCHGVMFNILGLVLNRGAHWRCGKGMCVWMRWCLRISTTMRSLAPVLHAWIYLQPPIHNLTSDGWELNRHKLNKGRCLCQGAVCV